MPTITRYRLACAMVLLLGGLVGAPHVHADENVTLSIQGVSPIGAISPGTQVTFVAVASGFMNPKYAVADSFTASGATQGSIDQIGFFTWTPGIYDAGKHTLTVTVTDSQDHTASSAVDILVSGTQIILSAPLPGPLVTLGRTITFTVTAPGFNSATYAVYDAAYGSTLRSSAIDASGSFSWTPTTDDIGIHRLTVNVSDAYGRAGQAVQVPITVVNPLVSLLALAPGYTARIGSPVTFTVRAPAFATTTYSVTDTFSGTSTLQATMLSETSGSFLWTPGTSDYGSHTLVVTARDVYGNTASSTLPLWVAEAASVDAPRVQTPLATTTPLTIPVPATTAVTPIKYQFTKNLGSGSRGTDVLELQKRLTTLGYYTGPLTSYFGALTTASVKKFQAANGISRVGTVGPLTRTTLNK